MGESYCVKYVTTDYPVRIDANHTLRETVCGTLPAKRYTVRSLLLFCLLFLSGTVFGANISSKPAGGNWNAAGTWVGGVIPGATDNVTIVVGSTVTLNVSPTCSSITVTGTLSCGIRTLTVTGNTTITGTLSFTTGSLLQGGNFTNNGVFTQGTGTVTFNGSGVSTQTISGTSAITFDNLTIGSAVIAPKVGLAEAITVTGAFRLLGGTFDQGSAGNSLTVETSFTNSSSVGANAFIPQTGTVIFGPAVVSPLTVTGTTTFNNVTCSPGAAKIVSLASNETVNGNLSITNGTLANTTHTLTVVGNTTITGTLSFTTGSLLQGGNFTNDGTFTQGTGTVTFNGSGASTQTIGGTSAITFNNLTIGSAVIAPKVVLAEAIIVTGAFQLLGGTFDAGGANNLTVETSFTNSSSVGTNAFIPQTGTVIFGPAVVSPLTVTGLTTFNNFTCSPGAGSTVSVTSNETVNGNLSITNGTMANTTHTLTVAGNTTITGTLSFSTGSLLQGGNFTDNGTFTQGTGTVLFNGSGTQTISGTAAPITFYDLKVNQSSNSGDTVVLAKAITVSDSLSIFQGALHCKNFAITGPGAIAGSGVKISANATFLLGLRTVATAVAFPVFNAYNLDPASNVIYQSNAAQVVLITPTYGNLFLYTGATSVNKTIAGTLNVAGDLVAGNGISAGVATLPATTRAINVTGNVTVNTDGKISHTTSTFTVGGNVSNWNSITCTTGKFLVTGSVANNTASTISFTSGTFTVTGSVVNSGAITYTLAGGTFTVSGNVTNNAAGTITMLTDALTITGNLTNNGSVTFSGTGTFKIAGNFTNNNTFTPVTTTALFNGSSTQTIGGTTTTSFYRVTISGTDVVLAHNENATNNVLITSGIFDGGSGSYTFNVGGNFTNNATFSGDNGTVVMNGAAAQSITGTASSSFYNLTISPTTAAITVSLGIAETVNNNLSITKGTLDVTASNYALSVGGNWTNTSAATGFQARAGTVTLSGSAGQTLGGTFSTSFYNITATGTGSETVTLGIAETVSNNLTISGGTFDVSASNYGLTIGGNFTNNGTYNAEGGTATVAGNFTNNATFNAQTGTLTFNSSTASQTIGGSTSIIFNNLTINNTFPSSTVTLNTNESFNGALTMTNGVLASASGITMTLLSGYTKTGSVAKVTSTAAIPITANFTVQRYEDVRGTTAGYAVLSAPVATTIGDWNTSNQTSPNTMYMSGVGGPNGNAIKSGSIYVSVFKIDETKSSTNSACYVPITTYTTPGINYVIQPGDGIYMWLGSSLTTMPAAYTYVQHGRPNDGLGSYNSTPVTVTPTGQNGFNVVGNPFCSPISWSQFKSDNAALGITQNKYYMMEPSGGGTWVGGSTPDTIAMCQGFGFVATIAGNAVFNEDQKLPGNPRLDVPFASIQNNGFNSNITFILSDDSNANFCPNTIEFGQGFTKNYEPMEDAVFIHSNVPGIPELYTTSADNKNMQFKSLPDTGWDIEVPLTAIAQVQGRHTITIQHIEKLTAYQCINLLDRNTGKVLNNFNANPAYSFNAIKAMQENDFTLEFTKLAPGQTCEDPDNTSAINVLPDEINIKPNAYGAVVKFNLKSPEDAFIYVYNMVGEKIDEVKTKGYDNSVQLNLSPGQVYIIKVQTGGGSIIKKLYH